MRRSTRSTERPSEQTGGKTESYGDSADPFLLDFGTSCVVNEDLRRTILLETNEIDASMEDLKKTFKSEERTQSQLTQDFKHAHEELKNIGRGTTDYLDKALVHSRILSGLGETIKVELVEPTVVRTSEANGRLDSGEASKDNSSKQSNEKSAPLKTLAAIFKEASKSATTAKADKAAMVEATKVIQGRIVSENLVEVDRNARRDAETHKKDEEDEMARKLGLEKLVQLSKAGKEKQSERLVENTKVLRLLRQENALEEEKLKKQLQEIDAEVATSQAKLTTSQEALTSREIQLTELRQQNSEIDRCRKLREEKVAEIKVEQEEIEKLSRIHENLCLKQEEAKTENIAANEALLEAEAAAVAAAEAKASNDVIHESEVLPGELELEGLAQEKARVPSLIAELEERQLILQHEYEQENAMLSKVRASLAKERLDAEEERKRSQSAQVVLASVRTESKENWEREIKELSEVAKCHQESIQAQEDRLAELRKEYEDDRRKIVEAKVARALAERARELGVLSLGKEVVDLMRQQETELLTLED